MSRVLTLVCVVAAWAIVPLCGVAADASPSDAKAADAAAKPARHAVHHNRKTDAEVKEADKGKESKADKAEPKKEDAKKAEPKKAEPAKTAKKEAKTPKKLTVVRFTLHGDYPEGPTPSGPFGEVHTSLAATLQKLEQAAGDDSVAAILLRIEDLEIGQGKVNEFRGAIARCRKQGKPVYAELTSADTRPYLVAAACDEIFMPPSGVLMLPGVRAEMTFYKGLFDKLGLQFDVLQQGKYKGAGEPLTRTQASPPLRESIEAIVNDRYDDLAVTIAQDRKLEDYQIKTLMDQSLFSAQAAQKNGLVDTVVYADQFEGALRRKLKADELKITDSYRKKQVDTDFSGIGGMVKLMELMFGGEKKSEIATGKQKIAVVYAVGEIVEGRGTSGMTGGEALGSTSLIKALRTADEDAKVAAIVLRIDSPGGSAVASDLIWREIVRIKKPVIASMSDVAGSGGYYIAMGTRKIVAEPGTITGSIGVIGGKMVLKGLLEKLGVTTEVISRGKNGGAMSSLAPFSPSERQVWKSLLEETYNQFVSKAAEGRKMPKAKLESLAQGRIYTGRMAVSNGLVDSLGTLYDAIQEAKKLAKIPAGEKVEILTLPKPKSFFEALFGDPSGNAEMESVAPALGAAGVKLPELSQAAARLSTLRRLLQEPTLLRMPCDVEIK